MVRRRGLSSGRWKRGGGVVKDEEEMAEAGEVEKEKRVMHMCKECAKNMSPSK